MKKLLIPCIALVLFASSCSKTEEAPQISVEIQQPDQKPAPLKEEPKKSGDPVKKKLKQFGKDVEQAFDRLTKEDNDGDGE